MKIKHVGRKRTYQKPDKEKQNKFREDDCIKCGAPNWNKQLSSPAKHFYLESEATSAEEDDWSPNKIHLIKRTFHSTSQSCKDRQPSLTTTAGY